MVVAVEVTVNGTPILLTLPRVAVMSAEPRAKPVARPLDEIVITASLSLAHVTCEVISLVVPFE